MTIPRRRNVHKEIQEIRSRLSRNNWDSVTIDVDNRLNSLEKFINTEAGEELHRYVILGSIAALETFHRGTIVAIVDSGDEYKVRASKHIKEKFLMNDAFEWISGKNVTFGEFIAHNVPCNSITDIIVWLNNLLDCDIKNRLADTISPSDRRNKTESPNKIIDDVDNLFSDLGKTFQLRHVFAHEAAPLEKICADECKKLYKSIVNFVRAIDSLLWDTIYKNHPYNQYEMNMSAKSEVLKARKELAKAMRNALSSTRASGESSWLRKNHFAWMDATMDWSRNTYGSLEGTLWPAVYGTDLAEAIQARTQQILEWNSWRF